MAKLGLSAGGPSGLKQIWKLWRHCCCRFGWYPLLVAPLVTASCLLDLYSSYGCEFLHVNVGFIPSNDAWNQSTATLGLFQFSGASVSDSSGGVFQDLLTEGCSPYSNAFETYFMNGDRTWEVARIMSYISGIAGMVAVLTSWLMVFTPTPVWLFWPGALLPALLVAFLCEGSKFLFLDTAICQSALWYPSGTDSRPQEAKLCELGKTSYFAIAAGACFFICLLMVCLRSPQKRELDENYGEGVEYVEGLGDRALDTSLEEDRHTDIELNLSNTNAEDNFVVVQKTSESDYASSLGDGRSFENPDGSNSVFDARSAQFNPDLEAAASIEGRESSSSLISKPASIDSDEQNYAKRPSATTVEELPPCPEKSVYEPSPPADETISSATRVVSQARISKAESMHNETTREDSSELIDKCVNDLEKSFQDEEL